MQLLRSVSLGAMVGASLFAATAQAEMVSNEILKGVTVSGLVEFNAWRSKSDLEGSASDLDVATVELGIDAKMHQWASARVLFLYEEGDDVTIDEAYVTLGNTDYAPPYLSVGRMYVFGNYATNMISDPLTLEIGEMQQNAVKLGFEASGLYGGLYAYKGDTIKDERDTIRGYGLDLGYAAEMGDLSVDVGVGYLRNLLDTGGMTDSLNPFLFIDDHVGGVAAHAVLGFAGFNLIAEYVAALDTINAINFDLAGGGMDAKPKAWNVEAAYTINAAGRDVTLALGYQSSKDTLQIGLPEKRFIVSAGVEIFDYTTFKLEWKRDNDYKLENFGSGDKVNTITAQIALEF
jgi:hypothetical protein